MKEQLPMMIMGHHIRIVPDAVMPPVLQISPDFPHVSTEFRAAWNAWALERFGRESRILFFQFGGQRFAAMTRDMEEQLRRGIDTLAHELVRDPIRKVWPHHRLADFRGPSGGVVNVRNVT